MAKLPPVLFEVKVDDTDARKKIETIIRSLESLSEILNKNSNIEINVSVVRKEKKWWQIWK
jgi:hypothetical protein